LKVLAVIVILIVTAILAGLVKKGLRALLSKVSVLNRHPDSGRTLASVNWIETDLRKLTGAEQAGKAGALLAQRAKAAGVETAVFDRGGYQYHGRVQAFADGAREAGLKF